MNTNLDLWFDLFTTNPAMVKPLSKGKRKISTVSPYWLAYRMTETFGPCGESWGIKVKEQAYQVMSDEVIHHWAIVELWYMKDGKRCSTEHMGNTKAKYKSNDDKMIFDEEAPKKSVTNGFSKCCSMLGLAGDVYAGVWDDPQHQEFARNYWNDKLNGNKNKNAHNVEWNDEEVTPLDDQQSKTNNQAVNQNNQLQTANQNHQFEIHTIDAVLNEIRNANDVNVLENICLRFKNHKDILIIKQACVDKSASHGWVSSKKKQVSQM